MNLFCLFLALPCSGVLIPVGTCATSAPSNFSVANLTMSVQMLEQICLLKVDARVGFFDNQLEWLQASLLEPKCRQSAWLVVAVGSAFGNLDMSIIDLIELHAVVDLVVADAFIPNLSIPQIVNGLLDVQEDLVRVYSACDASSPSNILRSQTAERIDFKHRQLFSKTSTRNIFLALLVSFLAGFAVNLSARRWIDRKEASSYTALS